MSDVHTCHAECPCQTGGEPMSDFLAMPPTPGFEIVVHPDWSWPYACDEGGQWSEELHREAELDIEDACTVQLQLGTRFVCAASQTDVRWSGMDPYRFAGDEAT